LSGRFQLDVTTRGGVCDLGRVVSVLALLDLTPTAFAASGAGNGLRLSMTLDGDARVRDLCVGRLRALVAVTRVSLDAPRPRGAARRSAGAGPRLAEPSFRLGVAEPEA
jgi:hypothetical protein